MFLHGSFDHLLGNMAILFIVGYMVEEALGKRRFRRHLGRHGDVRRVVRDAEDPLFLLGADLREVVNRARHRLYQKLTFGLKPLPWPEAMLAIMELPGLVGVRAAPSKFLF